jgi:hypothetical protein
MHLRRVASNSHIYREATRSGNLQPSFTSLWVFLGLMTTLMLFIGVKERIPLQEFFTDLVPIFGTLMLLMTLYFFMLRQMDRPKTYENCMAGSLGMIEPGGLPMSWPMADAGVQPLTQRKSWSEQ